MKKSTLLYIGAAIAFFISMAYAFIMLWNHELLKKIPFNIFPLIVFIPIFSAIFLTKKANAANNIEHNRPADAVYELTKSWKLVNYLGVGFIAIMALVLIVKNVVDYL